MAFKKDAGWGKLERTWNGKLFQKRIRMAMRKATKVVGKLAEKEMRETIRDGKMEANADLTTSIKKSTKPLVDKGYLFKAITSQYQRDYSVFVGVLRSSGVYDIAMTLHEGAEIAVTSKMRGLFFILWLASEGSVDPTDLEGRAAELWSRMPGGWLPLGDGTTHIIIPSRPFAKMTFEKASLQVRAQKIWTDALSKAQRGAA